MTDTALQDTPITPHLLRDWPVPEPDDSGGKGSRGTLLVVGGAVATPGAALLAGLAALRVGAGKLTIATVTPTATALGVAVPEAGVYGLPTTDDGSIAGAAVDRVLELADGADAVLLGPGLTGPDETRALVAGVLQGLDPDTAVLLDALGLTCGALDAAVARDRGGRVVVTPNEKEAGFLLGCSVEEAGGVVAAGRRIADEFGVVAALRSTVAAPGGRLWTDGSGHVGLGTSGSGDVLAGAIAGFLARGADPDQAAVWGAHLHADAGERLAARVGRLGFLARELLEELPSVLEQVSR